MSTPVRNHSNTVDSDIRPIENNRRSQNIPLPMSHMHRTQSEVQLCEDMETAEQRDLNMFYRLVNGIRDRQMDLVRENESSAAAAAFYDPEHALTEAERSLAHIIHTRNGPVELTKNGVPVAAATSTASFRFNKNRRSNGINFLNTRQNTNLNSGVPILEYHPDLPMHQDQQQGERGTGYENGWSVGGFDSSSNLSFDQQHHHQQDPGINRHTYAGNVPLVHAHTGIRATAASTLHTAPSSNEIADEGMFAFEL